MKFTLTERDATRERPQICPLSQGVDPNICHKASPIFSPLSQLRSLRQNCNKNTYTIQVYERYIICFRRVPAEMNQWNARIKQPYRNQSKSRSHSCIFFIARMNSIIYYYHFFEQCGAFYGLKWRILPGLSPGYLLFYFLWMAN